MNIVSRAQWGARAPKSRHRIGRTPRLWLHHFATNGWRGAAGMRQCQKFHMDTKGWSDIAYSFCVDNTTGVIYEGRGAHVAGGHTSGDNTTSHAICVMADTHSTPLSDTATRSIAWLTRHGHEQGWWSTPTITGGHRDAQAWGYSRFNGTACPGDFAARRIPEINELALEDDTVTNEDIEKIADRVHAKLTAENTAWIDLRILDLHERIKATTYTARNGLARLLRNEVVPRLPEPVVDSTDEGEG